MKITDPAFNNIRAVRKLVDETGVVVPIDPDRVDVVLPASIEGGNRLAEIYLRTDVDASMRAVRQIKGDYGSTGVKVGVGSCATSEHAQMAVEAGVDFIVSQGFYPHVLQIAAQAGVLYIPGVETPSEMGCAFEALCQAYPYGTEIPEGHGDLSLPELRQILKFFPGYEMDESTPRNGKFHGMAKSFSVHNLGFVIAGGIDPVDPTTISVGETDVSAQAWARCQKVIGMTSSKLAKGSYAEINAIIQKATALIQAGRRQQSPSSQFTRIED